MKSIITALSLVLLTGYSYTKSNLNQNEYKAKYPAFEAYIPFVNSNIIVGDKKNVIDELSYYETLNSIIDKKVIVYIDKLPFTKTFYTCEDVNKLQKIEEISKKIGFSNISFSIVKNVKYKSSITINNFRDNIWVKSSIHFINGFNVKKNYKENYLSEILERLQLKMNSSIIIMKYNIYP